MQYGRPAYLAQDITTKHDSNLAQYAEQMIETPYCDVIVRPRRKRQGPVPAADKVDSYLQVEKSLQVQEMSNSLLAAPRHEELGIS